MFSMNKVSVSFHDYPSIMYNNVQPNDAKCFYIRTSYRYEPDFSMSQLTKQGDILRENTRPPMMISIDARVSSNYQRIVAQTVADIFDPSGNDNTTKKEIRDRLTGNVKASFDRVVGGAKFIGLGDPLAGGTFRFEKGLSKDWPYKNLSAGEKAAFDLILDFVVKRESYDNTVFCIDEPEVHMNTAVQGNLLKELYDMLPNQSQLWIATHSIGMMKAAQKLENDFPGTVAFLDFGEKDFDSSVVMTPSTTDKNFWRKNFAVAIGELAELVSPTQIFVCEGDPNGKRKKEFDAKCYGKIFSTEFPDSAFISGGSSNEVKEKSALLSSIFSQVIQAVEVRFIVDRDDCNETERLEIIESGNKILSLRHLEAYLLNDEILEKFSHYIGKHDLWPQLQAAKIGFSNRSINERHNPSDDWKSIGENLRQEVRKLYAFNQTGSNSDAFMLENLVPLVTPDTKMYQQLRRDIFGV